MVTYITKAETNFEVWAQHGYRLRLPGNPKAAKTHVLFSVTDSRHDLLGWYSFKEELSKDMESKFQAFFMDEKNRKGYRDFSIFGTRRELPTTLRSPQLIRINQFAMGFLSESTPTTQVNGFARSSIHAVNILKDAQPHIRLYLRILLRSPTGVQYLKLDMKYTGTKDVQKPCFGLVKMLDLQTFSRERLDKTERFQEDLLLGW